MKKKKNGGVSL